MGSLHKNTQLMLEFLKVPFLVQHFSYYTVMTFMIMLFCNVTIYADDTTLCSKCDQASDMWQQLELASELESYLRDTVDWGKKWLVNFNAGRKTYIAPYYACCSTASRLQSHLKRAVYYYLPLSSQKYLVVILSTSEG